MTRILRLLLLAAVAWPMWQSAAAQEVVGPTGVGFLSTPADLTEMTALDDGMIIPKKGANVIIKNKEKLVDVSHVKNSPKGNPILKAEGTLVTPPAGKHIEEWDAEINFYRYNGSSYVNEDMGVVSVGVIIDGSDIYVCGLSYFMDGAWVKGTINGTTVSFPTGQYFGSIVEDDTEYPFYFLGANSNNNEAAVRFTYDATNKTLTLNNGYRIYEGNAASLSSAGVYNYRTNNTVLRKHRTGEQGVGIGSSTNSYVPVWGNYYERTQHNQMIYPESSLKHLKGKKLTSMTFFTNGGVKFSGGSVKVSLGTTTTSVFSSSNAITNVSLTQVASIVPSATSTSEWTITFSTPFQYDGNNLLVDIVTTAGSDQATSFYGDSQSGYTAFYSRSGILGGSNGRQQFLPKVRFTHETTMLQRNIVVEDSTFFKAQKYTWTDAEGTHESSLNDIATKPEQMIAMLREIYTNPAVPGNLKRGCEADGTTDVWDDVYYGGVGQIWGSGSVSNASSYYYYDGYGWNIPGDLKFGSIQKSSSELGYYCYMDTTQYRPDNDGLTLLLVEMVDDYDNANVTTTETDPQLMLRDYFAKSIKSIRVINEAKRTGTGFDAGYLFKIDCDKMNKFFLLAKGQLRWVNNSYEVSATSSSSSSSSVWLGEEFCAPPGYIFYTFQGSDDNTYTANTFSDKYGYRLFYHMFEQFSPVATEATHGRGDIYQDLVNMESFGVQHDCASVGDLNHQFMMYGDDSDAADCQDVRDMMFFIPDYRMMRGYGRDNERNIAERYLYYNSERQPMMGLYVIRQNEITTTAEEEDYYMLDLHWVTNLDDFLPSQDQEFELLQVVMNEETGVEEYVPVYYMNENGEYTDANGTVVTTPVPIVLQLGPGAEKNYPYVYVKRLQHGQQVTYAIRGRDAADADGKHFLSLQISNRQSYIVPGKDPTELVMLSKATYYSRYNPQTEKNCYSNKVKVGNYIGGLMRKHIVGGQNGTVFNFIRKTSASDPGVIFATAKITSRTSSGGTIQIYPVAEYQSAEDEFPYGHGTGKGEGKYAGYHANRTDAFNFTYYSGTDYVNFGNEFYVYDNFVEDLSEENLPYSYIYEIKFTTSNQNGETPFEAHGNTFSIPVYRTEADIDGSFDINSVESDAGGDLVLPEVVDFGVNVQMGSKTEIYRYDAYRWMNTLAENRFIIENVNGDDDEDDIAPTGTAGNQGDYYTVSMNDVNEPEYYETHNVSVASTGYTKATFIDNVPYKKTTNPAAVYDYAPVIEILASGFDINRRDYNTYGGLIQSTATGKLDVEVSNYEISSYSWKKGDDRYAYYNVELRMKQDDIPAGYEVYRVRAWREIDPTLLDEPLAQFAGRKVAKYLFEDMLGAQEQGGEYQQGAHMVLGDTYLQNIQDNSGNTIPVYRGSFGARKVRTNTNGGQDLNDGCVEKLDMTFKVRIYFTPITSSKAGDETESKPYYIAEYEYPFTINGGISTGIVDVLNARQVVSEKYYNPAGIESDTPFKGVNIVVTRYSDGSTSTVKVLK